MKIAVLFFVLFMGQQAPSTHVSSMRFVDDPGSKVVMECKHVDDDMHVSGCEITKGSTLDDLANSYVDDIKRHQEREKELLNLTSRRVDEIFGKVERINAALKERRKSLSKLMVTCHVAVDVGTPIQPTSFSLTMIGGQGRMDIVTKDGRIVVPDVQKGSFCKVE